MGFKKYLVGANNLPTDFAIGGLPLFSDDIKQLETNANIWGITSVLKGWSVILSGCLVDEVDTDSNLCTVTSGLVLIDDIVYEFDGYTGTYPFSITPGIQTTDERIFKDGNLKSVAIEYDYAIRTAFTPVANKPYPSDLSWNEIYFDPFCGQRAEIVLNNLQREIGETKTNVLSSTNYQSSLIIERTETNKQITGSSKPNRYILGNMRWANIGWSEFGNPTKNIRNSTSMTSAGNTGGADSNTVTLDISNIPQHHHGYWDTLDVYPIGNSATQTRRSVEDTASGQELRQGRTTLTSNFGASEFNLPLAGNEIAVDIENGYVITYQKVWDGYSNSNTDTLRSFYNPSYPPSVRYI